MRHGNRPFVTAQRRPVTGYLARAFGRERSGMTDTRRDEMTTALPIETPAEARERVRQALRAHSAQPTFAERLRAEREEREQRLRDMAE